MQVCLNVLDKDEQFFEIYTEHRRDQSCLS